MRKIIEDTSHDMVDLIKTIEELRREKEKLERVIASLEELKASVAGAETPARSPKLAAAGFSKSNTEGLA